MVNEPLPIRNASMLKYKFESHVFNEQVLGRAEHGG